MAVAVGVTSAVFDVQAPVSKRHAIDKQTISVRRY